jgi:PadR family transcriptional regulator, regulatory protein PadR
MSKSKLESTAGTADRELYSGLIRLHVLHHAVEGPIFGLGMIEELARHGYRISPRASIRSSRGLRKKGASDRLSSGMASRSAEFIEPLRSARRCWQASKSKVYELFHELIES